MKKWNWRLIGFLAFALPSLAIAIGGPDTIKGINQILTDDGSLLEVTNGLSTDDLQSPTGTDLKITAPTGQKVDFTASETVDFTGVSVTGLPAAPSNLGDLGDVDFSTPPTDGQIIQYSSGSSSWLPVDYSAGDAWGDPVDANIVPDSGSREVGADTYSENFADVFTKRLSIGSSNSSLYATAKFDIYTTNSSSYIDASNSTNSNLFLLSGNFTYIQPDNGFELAIQEAGGDITLKTADAADSVVIDTAKLEFANSASVDFSGAASVAGLSLDTLEDVDLTVAPTDGQILVYENASSSWKAATGAFGDLWSDALDSDIIPDTNGSYDLGSAAAQMAEVHSRNYVVYDETGTATASIAGASGNTVIDSASRLRLDGSNRIEFLKDGAKFLEVRDTGSQSRIVGRYDAADGVPLKIQPDVGVASDNSTGHVGGDLILFGGDGNADEDGDFGGPFTTSGNGGSVAIKGGNSSFADGGNVTIEGGNAPNGTVGTVNISNSPVLFDSSDVDFSTAASITGVVTAEANVARAMGQNDIAASGTIALGSDANKMGFAFVRSDSAANVDSSNTFFSGTPTTGQIIHVIGNGQDCDVSCTEGAVTLKAGGSGYVVNGDAKLFDSRMVSFLYTGSSYIEISRNF